jgi:hypothetical protein
MIIQGKRTYGCSCSVSFDPNGRIDGVHLCPYHGAKEAGRTLLLLAAATLHNVICADPYYAQCTPEFLVGLQKEEP